MAALKGLGKKAREQIQRVMELCGLEAHQKNRIRTLSGGYKQRVCVAQALLGEPELIILDEPTAGLDPEERIRMRNMFAEVARDRIMILSTHIIDDIQSICNRLIVLHLGKICYDGTPEGMLELAQGHVGSYESRNGEEDRMTGSKGLVITSKIVGREKTSYRMVGETLPEFAQPVQATLEDAYIYVMEREGQGT